MEDGRLEVEEQETEGWDEGGMGEEDLSEIWLMDSIFSMYLPDNTHGIFTVKYTFAAVKKFK